MQTEIERKFIDNTLERFETWCKLQNEEPDHHLLMQWLISKHILPKDEVKIGFVISEIQKMQQCRGISKTAAVWQIEANYGIPESTCFYILDKHQKRHW